eukprot:1536843-Prymnesium_polylepis.1
MQRRAGRTKAALHRALREVVRKTYRHSPQGQTGPNLHSGDRCPRQYVRHRPARLLVPLDRVLALLWRDRLDELGGAVRV